jgi:copper chaperone CopZ
VTLQTETVTVAGIRCERCVMRLGAALQGLDGLAAANANLMGEVVLAWDPEQLSRESIVQALGRAGFPVRE